MGSYYFTVTSGMNKQNVQANVISENSASDLTIECPSCHKEVTITGYIGTCYTCGKEFMGPLLTR